MFACCVFQKLWDCLDAWWAGSQATSRRATRFRPMQRAIKDELSAQLALHDATLRAEPPAAAPAASQPASRNPNPNSPLPQPRPATRSQEVQADPPAFRRLTETRTESLMPPRIIMQPAWHNDPYFVSMASAYIPTRSAEA